MLLKRFSSALLLYGLNVVYHCTYINSYSLRPIILERFVQYTSVQKTLVLWEEGLVHCVAFCILSPSPTIY